MVLTRAQLQYAEALYEIAQEQDRLEPVWGQLSALQQAIADTPELLVLLGHPGIPELDKLAVCETALGGVPDPIVRDFLRLLLERRRTGLLTSVTDALQAVHDRKLGVVPAVVETAVPISAQQRQRLEGALWKLAGGPVRLELRVDPSVIGGARVRLGDRLIDGSLTGRLRRLVSAESGAM